MADFPSKKASRVECTKCTGEVLEKAFESDLAYAQFIAIVPPMRLTRMCGFEVYENIFEDVYGRRLTSFCKVVPAVKCIPENTTGNIPVRMFRTCSRMLSNVYLRRFRCVFLFSRVVQKLVLGGSAPNLKVAAGYPAERNGVIYLLLPSPVDYDTVAEEVALGSGDWTAADRSDLVDIASFFHDSVKRTKKFVGSVDL